MNSLNKTKIIIDPGHGGFDPGGGSNDFFKEKDKNLSISKYQKMRFDELGIDSILVREFDETLDPNNRVTRINNIPVDSNDILISNHINSGSSSGGEVIYSIKSTNTLPMSIANNLSLAGLPIRNVYTRLNSRGKDYYFILRDTNLNNSMIIEYGFATDENDTKRLIENYQELAEAVVKAVAEYLGVMYTPPKFIYYNVVKNDTLYKIAKKYNTTIEKLIELNNLNNDELYIGQVLIIPSE